MAGIFCGFGLAIGDSGCMWCCDSLWFAVLYVPGRAIWVDTLQRGEGRRVIGTLSVECLKDSLVLFFR